MFGLFFYIQPICYKILFICYAESERPWPDAKLGPLNPKDKSCPLPGIVKIEICARNKFSKISTK
jgi:hypothetical protein